MKAKNTTRHRRKLNVHQTFRRRPETSSESLMNVQFTPCVYGDAPFVLYTTLDSTKKEKVDNY